MIKVRVIHGTAKYKADHAVKKWKVCNSRRFYILMSGPRVILPQLPILLYLLNFMRTLKNSYKPFAIILEEYPVR